MPSKAGHWVWSCFVCCTLMLIVGCREHPQVSSRESLDLIKQVYTACNTRNQERLAKCRAEYSELVDQGRLSEAEQASFSEIMDMATRGDWESAQASSLQFARDQVR